MIKLVKEPEPEILKQNKEEWTKEYLDSLKKGNQISVTVRFRYRHVDIKTAITKETYEKCIYCESKIKQVSPGEIDHILPISKVPEKILDWSNLTFCCTECNRRKSDYYDPQLPLLNPYIDNPDDYLIATGPCIFHVPNNQRGHITERKIELNRIPLLLKRLERLEQLNNLLDSWSKESNPSYKAFLKMQLLEEAKEENEYAFVVREYLREKYNI
jgi:5-methylcytosine-specific restriction endonuclease McrA